MQTIQENLTFDKVWAMFQETDKQFKETDRLFRQHDKKLKQLEDLFTSQWGKLIESLVEGDLINLLQKRNIKVQYTSTRVKTFYDNRQYEFDIIAENGIEIVIVEVKTTLKVSYVKEFLAELKKIKQIFPRYKNYKIYGAIAFLKGDENSENFAAGKGLFTIRATGNSASITNLPDFKPAEY